MNFHWIGVSFVKNLLCECGTQTHRHTHTRLHESEKALSKWANHRERVVNQYILVYILVASCICYALIGASGGLIRRYTNGILVRALTTNHWHTSADDTLLQESINFAHSFIQFYPCVSLCACMCFEQKRVSFEIVSSPFALFVCVCVCFGCGAFYRYDKLWLCIWHEMYTHIIISILIAVIRFIIDTLHSEVYSYKE